MKPDQSQPNKTVILGPGDFHFGGGHTRISTLLGSCVSITLWHPRKRIGGMCHFMMTERSRTSETTPDGRYAADAFDIFMRSFEQTNTCATEYQAKIFGGANMFRNGQGEAMDIGTRNIDYAQRFLVSQGIAVVAQHIAGNGRRKLQSGDVWLAFPNGEGAEIRGGHG